MCYSSLETVGFLINEIFIPLFQLWLVSFLFIPVLIFWFWLIFSIFEEA